MPHAFSVNIETFNSLQVDVFLLYPLIFMEQNNSYHTFLSLILHQKVESIFVTKPLFFSKNLTEFDEAPSLIFISLELFSPLQIVHMKATYLHLDSVV